MKAKDIMTSEIACCTMDASIKDAAQMMVDNDCGCIPIVESHETMMLQGVVTDRDIACRAVANGMNPNTTKVAHCMSTEVASAKPDDDLAEVERLMEQYQVRRIPVVNEDNRCIGMISQADIALNRGDADIAEVVKEVSKPMQMAA